jgi:hypothetical protein
MIGNRCPRKEYNFFFQNFFSFILFSCLAMFAINFRAFFIQSEKSHQRMAHSLMSWPRVRAFPNNRHMVQQMIADAQW